MEADNPDILKEGDIKQISQPGQVEQFTAGFQVQVLVLKFGGTENAHRIVANGGHNSHDDQGDIRND